MFIRKIVPITLIASTLIAGSIVMSGSGPAVASVKNPEGLRKVQAAVVLDVNDYVRQESAEAFYVKRGEVLDGMVSSREAVGFESEELLALEKEVSETGFPGYYDVLGVSSLMSFELYEEQLEISSAQSFEFFEEKRVAHGKIVQAEKDRRAAEAAAQAEAEAAAQAAAQAAVVPSNGVSGSVQGYGQSVSSPAPAAAPVAPAAPAAPVGYTPRIAGWGGQGLIDACVGAVWYTNVWLAEHWHCGGASFPKHAGAVVNIPGVGVFQSVGIVAVVSQSTWGESTYPYGYDLIYQTCLNNNPETTGFVGLMRIG